MKLRTNLKKAFTLAEALITLVIIGVIASLTVPAVLVSTEQNEYKTALKKALSHLNEVIEMNIALDGYGPVDTVGMNSADSEDSLFNLFRNRMNVISTSSQFDWGNSSNYAFFTSDGMRYEFPANPSISAVPDGFAPNNGGCATPGEEVEDQDGGTHTKPCLIVVDVNGSRKPNPRKTKGSYKVPASGNRAKILDIFPIIITDKNAYPYGAAAQRAMFQATE